jgi:hypothetical protein
MRRRIVIELGPTEPGEDVLRAAAALAARAGGELLGLFIEDPWLLEFAALPVAHEIGLASASRRPLETRALARLLRAQSAEAERRLASAAEAQSVPWQFRIQREAAAAALMDAALEAFGEALREELRLLLVGERESLLERWARAACAELAARARAVRAQVVSAQSAREIAELLGTGAPGVLLAPPREAAARLEELLALLEETSAPVLLLPAHTRARRRY